MVFRASNRRTVRENLIGPFARAKAKEGYFNQYEYTHCLRYSEEQTNRMRGRFYAVMCKISS
jgi:hypothetical protein